MNRVIQKVLVVRNDKLGDFMLAWPSLAMLKQSLSNVEVHALVPKYTKPIAEFCDYIDYCLIDPGPDSGLRGMSQLTQSMREQAYDAIITLYSTTRIGIITQFAGIPYRLAPATKIAQAFYNHRLTQRRSRSEKPEFEYNLDLIKRFLTDFQIEAKQPKGPFLQFKKQAVAELHAEFCQQYNTDPMHQLVFVHPGSGGSASNLSISQYVQLVELLATSSQLTVVISTGPGEHGIGEALCEQIKITAPIHYRSTEGLVKFAQHIQMAHLFISGSTGPLHIAGALDVPTVGFYPNRQSATALRWQTLNTNARRLALSPPTKAEQSHMSQIDIQSAVNSILAFYPKIFDQN